MGKPLSRPGCLRQSPCCSKKVDDREGYNEDGYIPQRSIYDTMCINEQIDHSSAHSTLGSRRGRETDFPSNGSLGAGGDMFEARPSVLISSGRKLDERFIFDSLKLANDEMMSRSPGGFVRSASPSVSCSSAPSGSINKRHHLQDSAKKDTLCRHSWKVLSPPKLPEPLELPTNERNYLNPGVAFFPNSITSPQISPFSGSPFSTGTHTPSVFFSPSPLPYHQQFHRQSLPTQPSSPRPPLSELSVSALMCGQDDQDHIGNSHCMRSDGYTAKDNLFLTFKPKSIEPEREQPSTTPEPENDTTPLLCSQTTKRPAISPSSMESTWPRRLIGRRRTVRQGGAVHNLPILPPLPSLLFRSVSDKKTIPRLSPFSEHQGNVDGQLGRSTLTRDLKDCSLQDWKILREREVCSAQPSRNENVMEDALEGSSKMLVIEERAEPDIDENSTHECEEENWEAVLEMVNSIWDESVNESDPQNIGSLRRWPLLHPPSGFGGSQAPSATSSELDAEDLLEIERMNREVIESQDDEEPEFHYRFKTCETKISVVDTQPLVRSKIPTTLDLASIDSQIGNKYTYSESPDSALTLDSDSSGIYMSNPSHTSREDITFESDRPMSDLGIGSTSSLSQGDELTDDDRKMQTRLPIPKLNKIMPLDKKQPSGFRSNSIECRRQAFCNEITTKATEIKKRLRPVDKGTLTQQIHNTVNTSKTDVPLPLSPSKHEVKQNVLSKTDTDSFVATDSFVYLAVSVPPPTTQGNVTKTAVEGPSPPISFIKPCLYPDECDFLSTDSFVYLAAPDCHLLVTEGHAVYGDSNNSESEDSGSKAEFVQGSAVGGDSDWDSDLTDSEHEPNSSKSAWDYWEELEQGVLQGLFGEDQSDAETLLHGNQAQQISCQPGELAAIVVQERAGLEEVS